MSHAAPDQVLTLAQMRAAEEALIAGGVSVDALMQRAGRGAAEYVWRMAAGRMVSVLVGPGNNGGDGWVIAEALREKGGAVQVVEAHAPRTGAAQRARAAYGGAVLERGAAAGEVLVDCLFGSGLTRPLEPADAALLGDLAGAHRHVVAVDLPSGVATDSGAVLNQGLPACDLTLALGAWKPAHFLMPAAAGMGAMRLVGIGCAPVAQAAGVVRAPVLAAPAADAHKYWRGVLAVVAGAMPGAALLAASAAQGAGAGYVKLLGASGALPADLVGAGLGALADPRLSAVLVGPGLGRGAMARHRLKAALASGRPLVLDADALMVLNPALLAGQPAIATPHEGELAALERSFGLSPAATKPARALALARASGMVVVAKGPDTLVAAPDGALLYAPRASSWLSVAGSGDVLAGCIASRLAAGLSPMAAAAQGVWLQGAAARLAGGPFSAMGLAQSVATAYRARL